MKSRTSFVSNSSTSSYIICGWEGSPSKTLIEKLADHYNVEVGDGEGYGSMEKDTLNECDLSWASDEYGDDEISVWGARLSTYNFSAEEINPLAMDETRTEMQELAAVLDLDEPKFYLVGAK